MLDSELTGMPCATMNPSKTVTIVKVKSRLIRERDIGPVLYSLGVKE